MVVWSILYTECMERDRSHRREQMPGVATAEGRANGWVCGSTIKLPSSCPPLYLWEISNFWSVLPSLPSVLLQDQPVPSLSSPTTSLTAVTTHASSSGTDDVNISPSVNIRRRGGL